MELPVTVVFEPPTHKELRALLRMRRTWLVGAAVALAVGAIQLVPALGRADAVASVPLVPMSVTSQPASASVWLDDHAAGLTPLQLSINPGAHTVLLKAPDALDARYVLEAAASGANLHAVLWRRQAVLSRVRSTLPGATLSGAELLADGQIALSVSLPAGHQMQAWRLDPASGVVEPLVVGAAGNRLRVSPDGGEVALLGYDVGPPLRPLDMSDSTSLPATVVWLTESTGAIPSRAWRAPLVRTERLTAVSWSPRADRLLVVASEPIGGHASNSRFWLLDASTLAAREVLTLPSDVVPGTELWSPDGQHVAFVARASGLKALCMLGLDGAFRYVADLEDGFESAPGFPVAAWSRDSQQLLFVAPRQRPPAAATGWLQQAEPTRVLYVAGTQEPTPTPVGDTTVDLAAWREDGQILGLGRLGADGALDIRLMNGQPGGQHLLDLPLKPSERYAASWDVGRAQLLIAAPGKDGLLEYWLARLGLDGQP